MSESQAVENVSVCKNIRDRLYKNDHLKKVPQSEFGASVRVPCIATSYIY